MVIILEIKTNNNGFESSYLSFDRVCVVSNELCASLVLFKKKKGKYKTLRGDVSHVT